MECDVPVIAVVGQKKTGKTYLIERLIKDLTKTGYGVASAKHISEEDFSIDRKGTDTWRHFNAGARVVAAVSNAETAVFLKEGFASFSPDKLLHHLDRVDILILEGFSRGVLGDGKIAKIVLVRDAADYRRYLELSKGEIIGFHSLAPSQELSDISVDYSALVEKVREYVRRGRASRILGKLPHLDCKECGYASCAEMAEAIYIGKDRLESCPVLKVDASPRTSIVVNGVKVLMRPFVSEIIRSSVLGMVSSLKGVSIRGNEELKIEISM